METPNNQPQVNQPMTTQPPQATVVNKSDKGFVPTILLCFFFGTLGVHRFFVGKIGTGVLQLVTLGGLGIWQLIDLIIIITGNFQDAQGRYIKPEAN